MTCQWQCAQPLSRTTCKPTGLHDYSSLETKRRVSVTIHERMLACLANSTAFGAALRGMQKPQRQGKCGVSGDSMYIPLNQMQTRCRLDHRGDLSRFQRERCLFEFLLHIALSEESPKSASAGAAGGTSAMCNSKPVREAWVPCGGCEESGELTGHRACEPSYSRSRSSQDRPGWSSHS